MTPLLATTRPDDPDREALYPWRLLEELVDVLKGRGAVFRTFKEVVGPDGRPPTTSAALAAEYAGYLERGPLGPLARNRYAAKLWRRIGVRAGLARLADRMITRPLEVFLQHDADRQPYKTVDAMRREAALGARSSAYFFVERNICDDDREAYDVDVETLQQMESAGFEVGYHLNAYELAGYDDEKASALVERDVRWFAQRFDLKSYVPHGGAPAPDGRNNEHYPQTSPLDQLVWAYSGSGVIMDAVWSDGYAEREPLDDPRTIARRAPRGARIHFLLHPQYFGDRLSPIWLERPIARCAWWRRLWGLET